MQCPYTKILIHALNGPRCLLHKISESNGWVIITNEIGFYIKKNSCSFTAHKICNDESQDCQNLQCLTLQLMLILWLVLYHILLRHLFFLWAQNKLERKRAEALERAQKRINKARKGANKAAGKVIESAMKKGTKIAKESEIQGTKNPICRRLMNLCPWY